MKSIWKFELPKSGKIQMPRNSKILSVQAQHGVPVIWAEVITENETEERSFEAFAIGQELPNKAPMKYLGTVQLSNGVFIWHIYETTI